LEVGVAQESPAEPPQAFHLAGSWPNPFNSAAAIRFTLPATGRIEAEIYDTLGRRVRTLAAAALPAGTHELVWDGRSQSGSSCPSGLYFLRLRHSSGIAVHKMALVR
ncbi:MAG TPA: FlgD immunoglobulin-like domain containing protein, partial [bacterium]|nr:FlgD immunoglobulin-like domain containing protein [bacterium]